MTRDELAAIKYFSQIDFANGYEEMDVSFVSQLSQARDISGIPYNLSSSYRDGDPRTHGLGKAVDIKAATGRQRFKIVSGLLAAGFTRIGVYDKHIHVDGGTEEDGFPQQVIWSGKSK